MKLDIDIDKLRSATQAAVAAAEKRRLENLAENLAEIKAKDEREAQAALLKAQGIVAKIPKKCAVAAEQGREYATVMKMTYSECSKIETPIEKSLKGAAAHVWNACQKAGLRPTVKYWHDGAGMKSGHNIVAHWEPEHHE